MKKYLKNFIIILLLGTYIYLYVFYILSKFLKYSESITAGAMIVVTFIAYLFYGYAKDKRTYARKSIFQIVITQLIIFFLVTYGLGLAVGFLKNSYSLKLPSIIDNLFAPFALIIASEILRYLFIVPNKNNRFAIVIFTMALIALEAVMSIKVYPLNEFAGVFRYATLIIIPAMMKHSMLSYITYHVGYKPSLLYRIIMDGYIFVVPISPDIGEYLTSMFGVGLPFLVYIYSSRFMHEFNDGIEREFTSTTFKPFDFVVILFFLCLAGLISGYFPIFMLGVGSPSMKPKINMGDAVIGVKVKQEELKLNDVIIYQGKDKLFIPILFGIEERNNKIYYHTKGDNNNAEDGIDISFDSIKGKVVFKIPYIAYPAVYFTEMMKGDD